MSVLSFTCGPPYTPLVRSGISHERRGELLVLLADVLWGVFPVVTILTYRALPPLFTAAISTGVAATFFAVLLTVKRRWHELLSKEALPDIIKTSLIIGVVFYGLTFIGIRQTTAGNASIMTLMEVFFAFFLLGLLLRHEPLIPRQIVGGSCMVLGALVILLPKASGWHVGDLIIGLAAAIPPIGNKYAKQARRLVSAECIMFCRSVIGFCFLFILALLLEPLPSIPSLQSSIGYLLLSGILLLGVSKILWIESINLITISKATAFISITPCCTLIVAALLLREPIHAYQLLSLAPIIVGILLLTWRTKDGAVFDAVG